MILSLLFSRLGGVDFDRYYFSIIEAIISIKSISLVIFDSIELFHIIDQVREDVKSTILEESINSITLRN